MGDCAHAKTMSRVLDQTLGVACADCGATLAYCWMDEHCSEAMWNAAADGVNSIPCEQSREDVCFLCGDHLPKETK